MFQIRYLIYFSLLAILADVLGYDSLYPTTLPGWNLGFDKNGELKEIDPATGKPGDKWFNFYITSNKSFNDRREAALGKVVEQYLYDEMEKLGLYKITLNANDAYGRSIFVFCTRPNLFTVRRLVILIHGGGNVRAGQWSRYLILYKSLDKGSQLPYIREAMRLGYDVLVLNTNDHMRYNKHYGVSFPIPGSETPELHIQSVWNALIAPTRLRNIAIVAHGSGGTVIMDLGKSNPKDFSDRISGVAFTDSNHNKYPWDFNELFPILQPITRNWVKSDKPLDTWIYRGSHDVDTVSAGHEEQMYTNWSAQKSVFNFLNKRIEARANWLDKHGL